MDSPTSDLKRDDALRKSIKKTRAPLAPLSPPPVRLADIDIGERAPLPLSPITGAPPPFKLFPSPLPKPKHFQLNTNFESDKRSSVPAHMLSELKIKDTTNKNRLYAQDEIDDKSDALDLDSIQKQINAVEEIFHKQQLQSELQSSHRKPSIDELKIRSRRYGETENLLQPCGSNMASGTDFCYLPPMNDSDCEEESEFKRGSEGRNSTGAKDFEKSTKNKINRTSSDTKNFDYVNIRQALKAKQVQNQQQQQQPQPDPKRKDVKELDDLLAKAAAKHNKRIPVPISSSDETDNGEVITKPTIPTTSSIIQRRNEAKYAQNLKNFEETMKKAKLAAKAAEGKNNNQKPRPAEPPKITAVTPKVSKVSPVVKPIVPTTRHSISPPPLPPNTTSTLPRNNRLAQAQNQVNQVKDICQHVYYIFCG